MPANLSFHLNQLRYAGLVWSRREGRSIIYAANFDAMNDFVAYLTENCCEDQPQAVSSGERPPVSKPIANLMFCFFAPATRPAASWRNARSIAGAREDFAASARAAIRLRTCIPWRGRFLAACVRHRGVAQQELE